MSEANNIRRPLASNTEIAGYKIIREISSIGGMSVVYQAQNIATGIFYVIKEIFPLELAKSNQLKRSENGLDIVITENCKDEKFVINIFEEITNDELRNANKLKYVLDGDFLNNNPNIFKSFQIKFKGEKNFLNRYIAIETEAGDCLSSLNFPKLETARQRIINKINTTIRICESVEKMHERGLLHCDLKPDNIYISHQGIGDTCEIGNRIAILLDFGSAIKLNDDGTVCVDNKIVIPSTVGYGASEILNFKNNRDSRLIGAHSDVFSIIKILMQLLCELSIENINLDAVLHNSDVIELSKPVRVHLKELLSRGLNMTKTRKEYYPTVKDFRIQLENLVKDIENSPYIINQRISPTTIVIGREDELDQINQILQESDYVFLRGMFGIGKSELATRYAQLHKNEYSAIVKVYYSDDLAVNIYDAVKIANYDDTFIDDKVENHYRVLREICNEKALIIVENFNVEDDPIISTLLTELGCKFIFNTRNISDRFSQNTIQIKTFEDKKVVKQLFYMNGPTNKSELTDEYDKKVDVLIETVASHTLTVVLLAKQLRESLVIDIDMLIEKLKNVGIDTGFNAEFGHDKDDKYLSHTAYEHIKSIIDLSTITHDEVDLLKVLSYVPTDGLEIKTFFTRCGFESDEVVNALNKLIRGGWVTKDSENSTISLHPIISEVVWRELKPSVEERLMKTYFENLNKIAITTPLVIANDIFYFAKKVSEVSTMSERILLDSAGALYKSSKDVLKRQKDTDYQTYISSTSNDIDVSKMTLNQQSRILLRNSLTCNIKRLKVTKKLYTSPNIDWVRAYSNIALNFSGLEKSRSALRYYQKALSIYEKNYMEDEITLPKLLFDIGNFYSKIDNYNNAISYCIRSIVITQKKLGEKHISSVNPLQVIGDSYRHLCQYDTAKTYFLKALDIILINNGDDTIELLRVYNSLGLVHNKIGEKEKALECYLKCEKISNANDSINILAQSIILKNIGDTYNKLKKYNLALDYLKKSMTMRERVFGFYHPDIAKALTSIGTAYFDLQQYEIALINLQKALDIRKQTLGEEHSDTAAAYSNVGVALDSLGKYKEALKYNCIAMKIQIVKLSLKNKDTVRYCTNIGDTYKNMKDYVAAIPYYLHAIKLTKIVFGENHIKIASLYNLIGTLYDKLDNKDKSLEYYLFALKFAENHKDKKLENIAISHCNAGIKYRQLGNYELSLYHYKKALDIRTDIFGHYNMNTAESMNGVGSAYFHSKSYHNAIEYYLSAYDVYAKLLGENHIDTIGLIRYVRKIYNIVACELYSNGKYQEALIFFQKTFDIDIKVECSNSINIVASYRNIGITQYMLGEQAKALQNYCNALEIRKNIVSESEPSLRKICVDIKNSLKLLSDISINDPMLIELVKKSSKYISEIDSYNM